MVILAILGVLTILLAIWVLIGINADNNKTTIDNKETIEVVSKEIQRNKIIAREIIINLKLLITSICIAIGSYLIVYFQNCNMDLFMESLADFDLFGKVFFQDWIIDISLYTFYTSIILLILGRYLIKGIMLGYNWIKKYSE